MTEATAFPTETTPAVPATDDPSRYAGADVGVGGVGMTFPPLEVDELTQPSLAPETTIAVAVAQQPAVAQAASDTLAAGAAAKAQTQATSGGLPAVAAAATATGGSQTTQRTLSALGCLRDAVLVALGALLGVAAALSLLYYVNGTLDFGKHERVIALASSLDTLQRQQGQMVTQAEQQGAALDQLQNDLSTLDATAEERFAQMDELAKQIAGLETQAGDLTQQIALAESSVAALDDAVQTVTSENDAIRTQMDAIDDEMAAVNEQVALLNESAQRFQTFVAGLRDLATSLAGQPTPEDANANVGPSSAAPGSAILPETPALRLFPPLEPIPQPAPGQSQIYGLVWTDANGDGLPSVDEAVLPNWQIVLRDAGEQDLSTMDTDANGRFLFTDITPGVYTLVLTPIAGDTGDQSQSTTLTTQPDLATEVNFAIPIR